MCKCVHECVYIYMCLCMCVCMCALKASRSRVEESRREAQQAVDTRWGSWHQVFGGPREKHSGCHILGQSAGSLFTIRKGAPGPGSGQSYTSGEVEGTGLRRWRECLEKRVKIGGIEMHRLLRGHLRYLGQGCPLGKRLYKCCTHGTEQSPKRSPMQYGQMGIGQWWCHLI